MLELVDVRKRFGRREVLRGVSLRVRAGQVVGLVGPNGAGKTTLLRIAVGYLDADSGSARIGEDDLATERTAAQARLGYLPEVVPCPGELVVERYLWYRAGLKGVPRRQCAAAVERALELGALGEVRRQLIGTLSKGFRQRVGLADAVLTDPPVLILDEPGSGLDPLAVRSLRDQLRRIAASRAVLLSSHSLGELEALADRVAVMFAGQIVAEAAPAELRASQGAASLEEAVLRLLEPRATPAAAAP